MDRAGEAGGQLVGDEYAGGGGQSIFVPEETLAQVLKNRYSDGSNNDGAL